MSARRPGARPTRGWRADQAFEHAGDQLAFTEYVLATQGADERLARLSQALLQRPPALWRFEPVVSVLRTLLGIGTVSPSGCRNRRYQRFAHSRHLMSYLGLVTSERSSGNTVSRGGITKTGNSPARRLLTESFWHYRYPERLSNALKGRQEGRARSDPSACLESPGTTVWPLRPRAVPWR